MPFLLDDMGYGSAEHVFSQLLLDQEYKICNDHFHLVNHKFKFTSSHRLKIYQDRFIFLKS